MTSELPGAFKYRNFRLFFFGQSISLVGTWMQQVAMGWLIYHRLKGSVILLGLLAFYGQIPGFILSPIAGVYTDRWDLRRTITVTQTLAMLQAAILGVLVLTDTVAVWHVVALERKPGNRHGLRRAGAAVISNPNGRRPRRFTERDRTQLVDV